MKPKPSALNHEGIQPEVWKHNGCTCAVIYRTDSETYLGSIDYDESTHVLIVDEDPDEITKRVERWAENGWISSEQ